jgi:hypothetical protein
VHDEGGFASHQLIRFFGIMSELRIPAVMAFALPQNSNHLRETRPWRNSLGHTCVITCSIVL